MALPYFQSSLADPELREHISRYLGRPPPPDPEVDAYGSPIAPAMPMEVPDTSLTPAEPLTYDAQTELARRYLAARQQGERNAAANHLGAILDAASRSALAAKGVQSERAVLDRPELADKPVKDLEAQLKLEQLAKQPTAAKGKAGLNDDPKSPEALRLQAAWKAAHPDVPPEVLSTLTPANLETWRKDYATKVELAGRDRALAAAGERVDKQIAASAAQGAASRSVQWAALRQHAEQFGMSEDLKLYLAQQEMAAREREEAEKKAEKEKGQKLPASEASALGDTETAVTGLHELGAHHAKLSGGFIKNAVGAFVPIADTDVKEFEDHKLATAQAVGFILEGGKLAAGDEGKYARMLPNWNDSQERADKKIANVEKLLLDKAANRLKALQGAGYDTGRLTATGTGTQRTPAPTDASGHLSLDTATPASAPPPPPTAPKYKPPPAGMKRIRLPDGRIRDIPAAKLREALLPPFNAVEVKE